jgi:hypothetical protein
MKTPSRLFALSFAIFAATGCFDVQPGNEPGETAERPLALSFVDLPDLGADYVYEGWLIVDGAPVTTGRFSVTPEEQNVDVQLDADIVESATTFVLTIEPAVGDDPAPSHVHLLAGDIDDNGVADLSIAHAAALGTDFADARGSYIIETPTSDEPSDYDQGVWFLDPAAGPGASLDLPELPEGWAYEGWVVVDGTPVSTGRFTDAAMADDDGAGPAAGTAGAPPFPGQDFIDPALVLTDGLVVISVEPEPDNSPAPFVLKPLVDEQIVDDGGTHSAQMLGAHDSSPIGVAALGAR